MPSNPSLSSRKAAAFAALAAFTALSLSACGGGGGGSSDAPGAAPPPTGEPSTPAPPPGTPAPPPPPSQSPPPAPAAGTWGAPQLVESDTNGVLNQHLAVAPNGKAVAAWLEDRGTATLTTYSVHARAYSPDTGWGATVSFALTGGAGMPEVAVNANGDAIVLWEQSATNGTNLSVNTIRYSAATGAWDAAPTAVLSASEASLYGIYSAINSHRVTLDNNGNAFYAFSVATILDDPDGAWVKQWRNGVWGPATRFLAGATSDAKELQFAASPDGKSATAIWQQISSSTNRFRMLASEYKEGSGWTAGHEIDGDLVRSFGMARITIADNGDTIAAWTGRDGSGSNLYATRLSNGSWSTPTVIDRVGLTSDERYIAGLCSDAAGNAVMVTLPFLQLGQVAARRFTVDKGWDAPVRVPAEGQEFIVPQASVGCNTKGDAMVSYRAALGANNSYDLWARPFSATAGWGTPAQIVSLGGPAGALTLSKPVAGLDDSFRSLTLWLQDQQSGPESNKPQDLWSATFK